MLRYGKNARRICSFWFTLLPSTCLFALPCRLRSGVCNLFNTSNCRVCIDRRQNAVANQFNQFAPLELFKVNFCRNLQLPYDQHQDAHLSFAGFFVSSILSSAFHKFLLDHLDIASATISGLCSSQCYLSSGSSYRNAAGFRSIWCVWKHCLPQENGEKWPWLRMWFLKLVIRCSTQLRDEFFQTHCFARIIGIVIIIGGEWRQKSWSVEASLATAPSCFGWRICDLWSHFSRGWKCR